MRQIAGRKLWIGNAGDLRDPRALFAAGIEAIVELADNEQLATLPRDLIRLRFPLSDGGANADWLIHLAVNTVAALVKSRVPTLICCSCGLNRSVCVAAGGLAVLDGRPFDEAILAVAKSGPADISPGLFSQFQSFIDHRIGMIPAIDETMSVDVFLTLNARVPCVTRRSSRKERRPTK